MGRWIHGLQGNPLTEMAKAGGARSAVTTVGDTPDWRVVFDRDAGRFVELREVTPANTTGWCLCALGSVSRPLTLPFGECVQIARLEQALEHAMSAFRQRPRVYPETASVADAIDYAVRQLGTLSPTEQHYVSLYRY